MHKSKPEEFVAPVARATAHHGLPGKGLITRIAPHGGGIPNGLQRWCD
jgi:hypothetical protein